VTTIHDQRRLAPAVVVPPLLLAVIALGQIGLARAVDLTPWKGGGFGMFSTLDHGAHRGVLVLVEAPGRSEWVDITASLESAAARAAACPTDSLLRRLAVRVVDRERRYERPVTRVTLTAWRTVFDPVTLRPSERTLRTFVYIAQ
jgi:hypothetical protein